MTESVYVVVLSYNGLEDTRKCLRSLQPALRPGIVPALVDNGSTDGTAEAVAREFPWCRIVRVEVNRGPVGGNNAGIQAAFASGEKWIMLLNNDTTVDPNLFERMCEAAQANPQYSVLGPVIYFMDDPTVVMTDGCEFNYPSRYGFDARKAVPLTESRPPRVTPVDVVNGCCLMIRAETLKKIGVFDERIFMYHDELDLCLRVLDHGEQLGVIDHALIWHKGSATSRVTGKKSIRYFDARNLWYVLNKPRTARQVERSWLTTRLVYFRYMYYWYAREMDEGNTAAATAVLDGLADGLGQVAGPYEQRPRRLTQLVRPTFNAIRWFQALGQPARHRTSNP
jgi:GT2 family glycosyltransferase